ncbi:MAG: hypothetical protein Q7R62_03355 [bacterium]|nr:hypothetical protein [bacterium]
MAQEILHSEIQELEAKLEAKKREMAQAGAEVSEKHLFKTVVHEHTGHEMPPANTGIPATPRSGSTSTAVVLSPADEQKVDELVMHAFTKGITSAVSEARKLNIPFLVDMLHDRLVDEYYQKLLESRKLRAE